MSFSTLASFAVAAGAIVIFALAVWRIELAIRAENTPRVGKARHG